jgi:hypothetical protein
MPSVFRLLATLVFAVTAAAAPLEKQMHEVERIRGLAFAHPVTVVQVGRGELPARMREQLTRSMPYALDDYMLILGALRLVDPEAKDTEARLFDVLQQQVLAYYDPLTHVYYDVKELPDAISELGQAELLRDGIAVHELTHALQDQRFAIGRRDFESRDDWDANLALHAVVEGEASLVMLGAMLAPFGKSVADITADDTVASALASAAASAKTFDPATPRYYVEWLKFPYVEGLRFVIAAYRRGGWKALDAVYENPPRSTREVLHPEEYFARVQGGGKKIEVSPEFRSKPAMKGILSVEHLGEFHWRYLVGEPASRGWRDDRVTIVQNAVCEPTVLVETRWESEQQALAFRDAYVKFLHDAEVEPRVAVRGSAVDLGYGADAALIERFVRR